ncbi:MAG: chromosomal replication initiator protein DnaA [Alloprevotella sp.]|nr:chromosomal replication initiator protein DnaA [Alloprevotella sp.]MBR1652886.1 chromosomal replication initiator protein DnaA [Alloprevotella sp.]
MQNPQWQQCLQILAQKLPEKEFETWFTPLRFGSIKAGTLTLVVPRRFVMERIIGHYAQPLQQAVTEAFGASLRVLFKIDETIASQSEEKPEKPRRGRKAEDKGTAGAEEPSRYNLPALSPLFTFENFIEGRSNKLARAVALSIAAEPGKNAFNPFFLYGPSGVGKTHLAAAIATRLAETQPDLRTVFIPAQLFKQQFTEATIANRQSQFIRFYQEIDLLILDDVQEITTAKTQQAFFHIFNHLQLIGKQIVLTSDTSPAQLQGMEERMLTRFRSGIVTEMEQPDVKLRRDILQAKIRRDGLRIPRDVVDYIAQNVESSVRELQGIINSLMVYAVMDNCEITVPMAERIVARAVNLQKREMTPERILRTVSDATRIPVRDIQSSSRKKDVVTARQLAIYLAHKYTDVSLAQIGRIVARRDHSTAMHSCNQIAARIQADRTFRQFVEEVEAKLK